MSVKVDQKQDTVQQTDLEKLHKVIVHNDDVTPYDFVLGVLIRIFKLPPVDAEAVTFKAHTTGIALVAILPLNEARKRVGKAHFAAALEGYPLSFSIEEA